MVEPAGSAAGDRRYRDGSYHAAVFSADPFVESVVARRRAAKLSRWIAPGDSVFEYGVGTVLNLRELRCGAKAGFDLAPDAAARCASFGVDFIADPASTDRRFDVVLCHHVLEHVDDPLATLRGFHRLLAPGGRLLLYVPFEFTRGYRRYRAGDANMHLYSWNALTLGNLAVRAGYAVRSASVRGYGYEQRLAKLARLGGAVYAAALRAARWVRPCDEVELVAAPVDGSAAEGA